MSKRKRFSRTVEKAIYEKYNGKCAICGREAEFGDGEIDHIQPSAKGGTDEPKNLQWLCSRCNKLKGSNRTNEEVKELLGITTGEPEEGEDEIKDVVDRDVTKMFRNL